LILVCECAGYSGIKGNETETTSDKHVNKLQESRTQYDKIS